MRKYFNVSLIVLVLATIFSCDYVSTTIEPKLTGGGSTADSTKVYRKVLVEDYTGHRCGNCPRAAEVLKNLEGLHPGKIIPLAVHCTNFANPNATYPDDFRTAEGTDYDNVLGVSASVGLPSGLVNRFGFGSSDFVKSETMWETSAVAFLTQEADFKIMITNTFNSTNNSLSSEIKVTALKEITGQYNLVALITEDSIIGPQYDQSLDPALYPGQINQNYIFKHVLRTSLNTAWGDQILNGTMAKNQVITKNYSQVLSAAYVPKNCHLIAYVYDSSTSSLKRYEVMQVEEAHVTE